MLRVSIVWSVALALGAVLLLSDGEASSQTPAPVRPVTPPAVRFPAEQPVAVSARVARLEQKVHSLEQRLGVFERVGVTAQTDGSYVLTVNGARVEIARDGRVSVIPAAPPSRPIDDPCDPPYTVDTKGKRSIKPECLQVGPCDPPYSVDAQGRRWPKKECL